MPKSPQLPKAGRPPSLATLQAAMAEAVMRPLGPQEQMHTGNTAVAEQIVKPNDRLSAFERLQIYNQQYWWRLLGAFGEDFPLLRAVIGTRKFDKLAVAYLHEHGSSSWNLRDLGQYLEQFLRAHPELTAPHTALALEVVQLEWARIVAFDGPELSVIDPARLANSDPGTLCFRLQPYLTLLEVRHPVDELSKRLKRAEAAQASNAFAAARRRRTVRLSSSPLSEPLHLAVHRVELSVYFKRLEPEAFALLQALHRGVPLEGACEEAFANSTEEAPAIGAKVQEWFAAWSRFGWLCQP